jgi:hypothetical protein
MMADTSTSAPPTRQQILDAAQAAVLAKGFSGTSIDELIAAVGISKSGFFYHFRDKTQLAMALLERYVEEDGQIFDRVFAEADDLSEDPLHSFLIGLKMLAKIFEDCRAGIRDAWSRPSVTTNSSSTRRSGGSMPKLFWAGAPVSGSVLNVWCGIIHHASMSVLTIWPICCRSSLTGESSCQKQPVTNHCFRANCCFIAILYGSFFIRLADKPEWDETGQGCVYCQYHWRPSKRFRK